MGLWVCGQKIKSVRKKGHLPSTVNTTPRVPRVQSAISSHRSIIQIVLTLQGKLFLLRIHLPYTQGAKTLIRDNIRGRWKNVSQSGMVSIGLFVQVAWLGLAGVDPAMPFMCVRVRGVRLGQDCRLQLGGPRWLRFFLCWVAKTLFSSGKLNITRAMDRMTIKWDTRQQLGICSPKS